MPPSPEEIIDQIRHNPKLIIADDFEFSVQHCRSQSVKYRNGDETGRAFEDQFWIGLRLVHRKRPGRSSTFLHEPEALSQLVDDAFESAKHASPDPWFRFPLWKKPKESATGPNRKAPSRWDSESLYPCLAEVPEVVEEVYEQWAIRTVLARKSERFQLSHHKDVQALHFSLFGSQTGVPWRREEDRAGLGSLDDREDWMIQLLNESARFRKTKPAILKGRQNVPVIWSPSVVSQVLKRMAGWFSADAVQHGRSPLAALREKAIFSESLTLLDDGTYLKGVQSAPFDLEGSPTQRTTLVDKGTLVGFLYDAYTATRENRLSTGNLMRFPQRPSPSIQPTNLFFAPGDVTARDLVAMVDEGVLWSSVETVEPTPGTETRIMMQGSGWTVSQGKLDGPLGHLYAEVDLVDLLRQVISVGNDLNFFGGFGSPSILFEKFPLGI